MKAIQKGILCALPDTAAIRCDFLWRHGRLPNLANPRSFSERIQHRKLYERDPRFPKLADKVLAKNHVAAILGGGG